MGKGVSRLNTTERGDRYEVKGKSVCPDLIPSCGQRMNLSFRGDVSDEKFFKLRQDKISRGVYTERSECARNDKRTLIRA